jgi:hypothetical protein
MKHIKNLALLMIAALAMTSCELFNVDVDSTLSGDLDVYVEESMAKSALNLHPFVKEKIIDAFENKDVEKYSSKVDGVAVEEIVATVESLSLEGVELSAETVFYIKNSSNSVSWSKGEAWTIHTGDTFTFDNLGSAYDEAAAIIEYAITHKDDSEFTIGVDGECSDPGVSMKIRIDIKTIITAGIL